ncbi:hypothetical protein J3459_010010 [Metarhizium acridum]|nr:hypothetical protein J3459_010010 [Metarhizium acridum]
MERNTKDSIKPTWRQKDHPEWTIHHWVYDIFDIHPVELDKAVPVHPKTDKVSYLNDWYQRRRTLYSAAFNLSAIRELHLLRALGHRVGFVDGDVHGRDGVPDVSVSKVLYSLVLTSFVRPAFTVYISYITRNPPASMAFLWLPFEASCYGILLDFFFYCYHRLMHDVEGRWKFHCTHHLTKHPNPLLSLYADTKQEIFDIAGVPQSLISL